MKIPQIKLKIPKIYLYGIDVVKNFLFFTLFIIFTLISISIFIAPSIKTFKKSQKEYFKTYKSFLNKKAEYEAKKSEFEKLKKDNRVILSKFKRDFNTKNFANFSKSFIDISSIEKNSSKIYKKRFLVTSYYIHGKIDSPKNFYNFVDNLKKYKNVIKVYFPVDFEKKEKIDILFKIEHFKVLNKK